MPRGEGNFQSFEAPGSAAIKIGRLSLALAYIDKQVPSLTYLGLALWIAWNTVAFSGTAWFYDPARSVIVEELITEHLVACIATSLIVALTAKRSMYLTARNWSTLLGGCMAALGTLFIVV